MKYQLTDTVTINTILDLKKVIIAYAVATGNTFGFHGLYSSLKEFGKGGDDAEVNAALMDHIAYLLPDQVTADSPDFKAALKLVEKQDLGGDVLPGSLLEEAAKNAVLQEKFAYAEDAYRLLGIKKEIVGLYAQRGEQFLKEGKPSHAAMSFLIAASIDQPVGPNFQYLGPQLHAECPRNPNACVTNLPVEDLMDAAIHYLLSHDSLSERLLATASAEQKQRILGTLAQYRDENISDLVRNLRKAAEAFVAIHNGKPNDYAPIGPLLLGRPTVSGQAWQYLREFSYEHPLGALCVCIRAMREKTILIPVIREGKSVLEFLLPPELLAVD